jgi:CDP-diglyceride synthetase
MTLSQWQVLFVYFAFILIATVLAFVQRWIRPSTGIESLRRKYPTYILINLTFLFVSWLPPIWHALNILLAALGGLAAWEITRSLINKAKILACVTMALVFAAGWLNQMQWFAMWFTALLVLIAINTILGPGNDFEHRTLALTGSAGYLPLCLAAYLWAWHADINGNRVAFLYLTVATNDAMAQIIGQLFGARQLAPHISPAKTIEGALGGIFFAGVMGFALSPSTGWSYWVGTALGLAMGIAGLIGDLTASTWKRALGLKNFSSLLGAHGGIMDRFDGLIFSAAVFYILTTWF